MKADYFIALSACVFLAVMEGHAQQQKAKTQAYHLKKAKTYQTVGIVTGGTCLLAIGASAIVGNQEAQGIGETLDRGFASTGLLFTGIAAGATSITFFILSGNQKRKAASIQPIAYTQRIPLAVPGQHVALTTQLGIRIHF